MNVAVLLFEDFETLDVFGPVEIFGRLTDLYTIKFYSLKGGMIKNRHGVSISSENIEHISDEIEVFVIPGGIGTRKEISNTLLIGKIATVSKISRYTLTVCTGSALLAKTGLLNNKMATSNKKAFAWVTINGENVKWNKTARWVVDDKYYTSSGVTAGMDMALGFLSDRHGTDFARKIAREIEYKWVEEKNDDGFTVG
jgi:putative intracellular protease/amidase